jgi:hypothetical protein
MILLGMAKKAQVKLPIIAKNRNRLLGIPIKKDFDFDL